MALIVSAQEIPLGTWRAHASYNAIHAIVESPSKVYAASTSGLAVINKSDRSGVSLTKTTGLSGSGLTALGFDSIHDYLIIGYSDGLIDILTPQGILKFDVLQQTSSIIGSKQINGITVTGNLAYLSTDFGVVVFDTNLRTIRETWRDLGASGEALSIRESVVLGDTIFLATQNGVLAGDLGDNLLDYTKWKRFATGAFAGEIQSIAKYNNEIYVAINTGGIYQYSNGGWVLLDFLQTENFNKLASGNSGLLITQPNHAWRYDGTLHEIESEKLSNPNVIIENTSGVFWIGDYNKGIVSNIAGAFDYYTPNGPSFTVPHRLRYDSRTRSIFGVSGGPTHIFLPRLEEKPLNVFRDGQWNEVDQDFIHDLSDITWDNTRTVVASFGYGIKVSSSSAAPIVYDETNSPLQTSSPGKNIYISALASSTDGIWVVNYGVNPTLHLLTPQGTWQSFFTPSRFITQMIVDLSGNIWMSINPDQGGGLIVRKRDGSETLLLTNTTNFGGLPNRFVHALALDRDGRVWVGTEQGVAYYANPNSIFSGGAINATRPVFENRNLLRDERILSIAVDGGNRKWFGTERGLWLFSPEGDKLIYNFTKINSPLPDDRITCITVHDVTGEVFFSTPLGLVSYRADATATQPTSTIKIFPNPVTARFNGLVSMSGLTTDAIVKITDVTGNIVWQTQANGNSASWNVTDIRGSRVKTGIYLVFSIAQDGSESVVGKIAVVE